MQKSKPRGTKLVKALKVSRLDKGWNETSSRGVLKEYGKLMIWNENVLIFQGCMKNTKLIEGILRLWWEDMLF